LVAASLRCCCGKVISALLLSMATMARPDP
jgi:hypothetical protein